jgi:hypothetical protein
MWQAYGEEFWSQGAARLAAPCEMSKLFNDKRRPFGRRV